jgi:hypothetical protein
LTALACAAGMIILTSRSVLLTMYSCIALG